MEKKKLKSLLALFHSQKKKESIFNLKGNQTIIRKSISAPLNDGKKSERGVSRSH